MRVAYLQKAPSGHMNACLRQLVADGVEVLATVPPVLDDAPYEETVPACVSERFEMEPDSGDDARLLEVLDRFAPDVTLVVGWDVDAYRRVARRLRGRTVRVLCTDNQWMRTPRQLAGVVAAPWYLHRSFDRMFVPGERQRRFARRLGFRSDRIDLGFYTADVDHFVDGADRPPDADAFVFVGRLIREKGVDVLLEAYGAYRERVEHPLDLLVAGTGPMAAELVGRDGVVPLGFVSPPELPAALRQASALVLPSRFEPWGVVVHEAACSGLAVIASTAVGAADAFVDDGVNGRVGPPAVEATLAGLLWWHRLDTAGRQRARSVSVERAMALSPATWSSTVRAMAPGRAG